MVLLLIYPQKSKLNAALAAIGDFLIVWGVSFGAW